MSSTKGRGRTWTAPIAIAMLLLTRVASAEPDARSDGGVIMSWDSLQLRGVSTKVRGSNSDRSGAGAAVGSEGILTLTLPAAASPVEAVLLGDYLGALGLGSNGLEGAARANMLLGALWSIRPQLGPYVRVGGGGALAANQAFDFWHVEPEAQVGFLGVRHGYSIDLGGEIGHTLVARFDTGQQQRRALDDTSFCGGFARLQLWSLFMRAEYRAYVSDTDLPAPSEWGLHSCVAIPAPTLDSIAGVNVCFDLSRVRAAVLAPGQRAASNVDATYAGVSVGGGLYGSEQLHLKSRRRQPQEAPPAPREPREPFTTRTLLHAVRVALEELGHDPVFQRWVAAKVPPRIAVLPMSNHLSSSLPEDMLEAGRLELERWFDDINVVDVVSHADVERATGMSSYVVDDDMVKIGRAVWARYLVHATIERAVDGELPAYALQVRIFDVTTRATVWRKRVPLERRRLF